MQRSEHTLLQIRVVRQYMGVVLSDPRYVRSGVIDEENGVNELFIPNERSTNTVTTNDGK